MGILALCCFLVVVFMIPSEIWEAFFYLFILGVVGFVGWIAFILYVSAL